MFKNKNIWIIGASKGIGAELATRLAWLGANVAISGRHGVLLNQIVYNFPDGSHIVAPLDLRELDTIDEALTHIRSKWHSIDMIIVMSGVYEPKGAMNTSLAIAENTLNTNLLGIFRLLDRILPVLRDQQQAHLVLTASVAGYGGLPNSYSYGVSKAGIIHLAECLKLDVPDHIKVQVINPGFVETELTAKNNFAMPFIMSTQKACSYILRGLESERFEIKFPFFFANCLKLLKILPYFLYFWLIKKIVKN